MFLYKIDISSIVPVNKVLLQNHKQIIMKSIMVGVLKAPKTH